MRFNALLVGFAMCLAPAAWAVNKCTGADGKVVFQDAPCADGKGQKMDIRPASGSAGASPAEAQLEIEKLKRSNAMAEAIRSHKPLIGMSIAQLQEAMGPASKVNADNYNGVQREQVIYERPGETWYVYTRSGVVESIQHRPGEQYGAAPRPQVQCPSAHEIRNAKVSASSNMLGEAERVERLKSIREMEACGR